MSTTNPLLLALKAKGCTVDETLSETLMNNEKLYERLLRKLPNLQCVTKMAEALAAKDATALFEAGHEIKGVYASLGLKPLLTVCSEIVEIARKGELTGIDEKLPVLQSLHDEIVKIIVAA
ncbi:MAG: Hpt domain-containing protein [Lentisphaeria bacterium]|nr:Hpt domain-containing protein [Victivallales bacterium]MBR6058618.1 Hpt domain-containing protein [Victivallales bacterium]MCR4572910.1 Hpt domain-containing protein [Lentisphaeria bacterium]